MTQLADVVLPVAPAEEKAGTFLDWEGRRRPFDAGAAPSSIVPDTACSTCWPTQMDVRLGLRDLASVARPSSPTLGAWDGARRRRRPPIAG